MSIQCNTKHKQSHMRILDMRKEDRSPVYLYYTTEHRISLKTQKQYWYLNPYKLLHCERTYRFIFKEASERWFFPLSIQTTYYGTNRFRPSPKIKVPAQAQLSPAKSAEQTRTKLAVSVPAYSTPPLGKAYVSTGPFNLKSGFPATQSWGTGCFPFSCNLSQQLLAFEHRSLKSNKLFKDNVAVHACSATKVTCRDPRKRLNKNLVVGSKVIGNIFPLHSCQNSLSIATYCFSLLKTLHNETTEVS